LLKPASPKSTRKTNDRLVRRFRRWRDVGGRDAIRRFDAVPVENKPPSTPQTAHGLCFSLARIRSICPYSRHKSFEPILRKDSTGFGGRRWRVIGRGLADRPFSTIAVFARRRHHTVRCLVTVPHLLGEGLSGPAIQHYRRVRSSSAPHRPVPRDGPSPPRGRPYEGPPPGFRARQPGHSKRDLHDLLHGRAGRMSGKFNKLLPLLQTCCRGAGGGTLPLVVQLTVFAR